MLSCISVGFYCFLWHWQKRQSLVFIGVVSHSYRGLFEMIVGVLTTCHTQYTWDSSICIFLFNRKTLQFSVTYLIGALYVHPLWFYKHQHDNPVRSKLSVACQRWWFQWPFWFVPSVPGYLREEEEHKPDPWRNPIERNLKKYIYSYLKCIVYDKLLKLRQSFRITLYFLVHMCWCPCDSVGTDQFFLENALISLSLSLYLSCSRNFPRPWNPNISSNPVLESGIDTAVVQEL